MPKISIITDTNASLPSELIQHYPIYLVPQSVIFGDQTYEAVFQINDAEVFAQVERDGRLPTTAAPSPGRFARAYQQAFEDGAEALVCFCVSSEVSATYEAGVAACELLPGREITVVDSCSLTVGQGFMVLAAAEAAMAGKTAAEIVAAAESVRGRTHLFAALPTLKYLRMSGRVGHLAAGMATMLDIKPILTIKDGRLAILERVRTWRKSWARMTELAQKARGNQSIDRLGIAHCNNLLEAKQFQSMVCQALGWTGEVIFCELTPGMSPHSGAGMLGVAFVTME
jgi:DegV family protein with EDD domain